MNYKYHVVYVRRNGVMGSSVITVAKKLNNKRILHDITSDITKRVHDHDQVVLVNWIRLRSRHGGKG